MKGLSLKMNNTSYCSKCKVYLISDFCAVCDKKVDVLNDMPDFMKDIFNKWNKEDEK